jgi:hypothetical protein
MTQRRPSDRRGKNGTRYRRVPKAIAPGEPRLYVQPPRPLTSTRHSTIATTRAPLSRRPRPPSGERPTRGRAQAKGAARWPPLCAGVIGLGGLLEPVRL